MNDLCIRPANTADLPAILDLYRQPDMDDGRVLTLPDAERLLGEMKAIPGYDLYVALSDERIVGTYALLIMPNLGHCGTPSGVLENIVVAPDVQGAGIGTAMIEDALARCREQGCYKLTLSSNLKRERAHAFYDRLGFERHGYSFLIRL